MIDYSKMSDQQINTAIAKRFPDRFMFNDEGNPYSLEPDSMASYSGSDFDEVEFDPCNNPADAWPIILDNRIALTPYGSDAVFWEAEDRYGTGKSYCDNYPLRAAMIVFLMMQESE